MPAADQSSSRSGSSGDRALPAVRRDRLPGAPAGALLAALASLATMLGGREARELLWTLFFDPSAPFFDDFDEEAFRREIGEAAELGSASIVQRRER